LLEDWQGMYVSILDVEYNNWKEIYGIMLGVEYSVGRK
jgi:hypothetical protein